MSAFTDFRTGPGIPPELANEARAELHAAKESMVEAEGEVRPIGFTDHKSNTRAASNAFLEKVEDSGLPQFLDISPTDARKRFKGSQPGLANSVECTVRPGRTDLAYTILALEDLSTENGLPALGSSKSKPDLKKGEVLHFMGDTQQTYSGNGGGALIWFQWSNLSGGS